MPFPTFNHLNPTPEFEPIPDFHAVMSVQLGDLINDGFINWSEQPWDWSEFAFNQETYERLCAMFNERYFFHEISMLPVAKWRMQLLYKIKYELCPKYNKLYKSMSDLNPLAEKSEYEKSRSIDSEFPETLLSGNSDYVSKGNDLERSKVYLGNSAEMLEQIKAFKDIDAMFIDELSIFFSGLYSVSVNGW